MTVSFQSPMEILGIYDPEFYDGEKNYGEHRWGRKDGNCDNDVICKDKHDSHDGPHDNH